MTYYNIFACEIPITYIDITHLVKLRQFNRKKCFVWAAFNLHAKLHNGTKYVNFLKKCAHMLN